MGTGFQTRNDGTENQFTSDEIANNYIFNKISNVSLSAETYDFDISGDDMYIAAEDGVHLFDISDPVYPLYKGKILPVANATNVEVYFDFLFVYYNETETSRQAIHAFDLHSFNRHTDIDFISTPGNHYGLDMEIFFRPDTREDSAQIIHTPAFRTTSYEHKYIDRGLVGGSGSQSYLFEIYDINSQFPEETSHIYNEINSDGVNSLLSTSEGLKLFELNNEDVQNLMAQYNTSVQTYHSSMDALDGKIRISVSNSIDGIRLLKFYPNSFSAISQYNDGGNITQSILDDELVFAADSVDGLEIIDFTDIYNPVEIFEDPDATGISQMKKQNELIYTTQDNNLVIYHLTEQQEIPQISDINGNMDGYVNVYWQFSDQQHARTKDYLIQVSKSSSFDESREYISTIRSISIPIYSNDTYYFRIKAHYKPSSYGNWSATVISDIQISENKVTVTETDIITETTTQTQLNFTTKEEFRTFTEKASFPGIILVGVAGFSLIILIRRKKK